MPPNLAAAKAAHRHADTLDRQILTRWPHAWTEMDRMRRDRPMPWPDWCLLPMGAAAAVTGPGWPPPPIAQISALYAWRYSRAVYLIEPGLMSRLLTQVPDDIGGVDTLAGLPHWCVYIADDHPEFPGAGLWAHLEHDVNTGRPELRILIDMGYDELGAQIAVPIYLDRPSITEAIADFRANAEKAASGAVGANIRGGDMDAAVARMAGQVDGYIGLLAYLARPEADIRCVDRPGVSPVRPRSPVRDRTTWAVGYGG